MNKKSRETKRLVDEISATDRKLYATPNLTCFGEVRALTASGSDLSDQEQATSSDQECSQDKNRGPCIRP
jgi:hypothetical protein